MKARIYKSKSFNIKIEKNHILYLIRLRKARNQDFFRYSFKINTSESLIFGAGLLYCKTKAQAIEKLKEYL